MLEIRTALPSDFKDISRLGRKTFTDTFGQLFRFSTELNVYLDKTFSEEKIKNSLVKAKNQFWIAHLNNLPVGYAKVKFDSVSEFIVEQNHVCQLQKIYVLNEFLSKKVGYKIHEHVIKDARMKQYEMIWLSVLESNHKAVNFYKKNDYKTIGSHMFTIGSEHFDFISMAKPLKFTQVENKTASNTI